MSPPRLALQMIDGTNGRITCANYSHTAQPQLVYNVVALLIGMISLYLVQLNQIAVQRRRIQLTIAHTPVC